MTTRFAKILCLGITLVLSMGATSLIAQTEQDGGEQTGVSATGGVSGIVDEYLNGNEATKQHLGPLSNEVEYEKDEEILNALFRGEGLFREFKPEDELVEKRSRSAKHFRNPDGTVTALMGAGDLHYLENGKWESILSHIFPNSSNDFTDYKYAALHNAHKIYFPENPGNPTVTKIGNDIYKDWGQPTLVWLDSDANVLSEVQSNTTSTGVPVEGSISYAEIFPSIDAEILNSTTSKKLSYNLKNSSVLSMKPAGAAYLAFRESVRPNGSWQLKGAEGDAEMFSSQIAGQLKKDIFFEDENGGVVLEINTPVYFEEYPIDTASCSETPLRDSSATYSGNYLIKQVGAKYDIYTLVPVSWLTNANRDFPLVIDPITNYYPGGTWPTYTAYRSSNSGSWACATGAYGGRVYPNSDISYGWVDDSWPTNNPFLDGYATFNIAALPNNDCVSAVTYYWYHYAERNCGTDVSLKLGQVQFNANLAEEASCNVTGTRIRNNNNYYSGTGYNSNGWKSRAGSVADFGLAMPGNQITLGWAYNCEGGDCDGDCCSSLCTGNDGNYHHVYGYEHPTAKPYARVTYNAASTAPTFATTSVNPTCPSQSVTLTRNGGTLGTSANWEWYSGSCGGTSVGSGTSISVSPASTTTYYVRAEGPCNTTSCVSITVNVTNTNSTMAASASASVSPTCPSGATTLNVSGGSLGTGASWNWYSGGCGSTSVGSGSSLGVAPTSTTTYYVRAEGTCNTTGCRSVTVTVNTNSGSPTGASASVNPTCPSGATTLSVTGGSLGTGASWDWYTGSCGGAFVGSGSTLGVSPASTITYYVRASGTCNTTACASVTVTVNTNSSAPASAAASVSPTCPSGATTLSVSGGALGVGASWDWYSGSCGGAFVGSGSTLGVSPATTTTYYVRAVGTCNTTACASVTVTVNTNSAAPASASASVNPTCPSGATTLSITGGSLGTGASWSWYSGSCGGTLEGTGASLAVSPATTTTYYIRAAGTCNTTSCVSVTVIVNTISAAPTGASTSADPICDGASTTLSVSGGSLGTAADWNWYTVSCGGTPEGTGSSIAVSPSTSTTYYVRAEGTCNTTTCTSVLVTVDGVPVADAGTPASVCGFGATLGANPSIGTGTWTQTGVPPSVATFTPNANDPNATATVTVYGTYLFRWTEVNAACSDFDDVQVDYYEQPISNAGVGDTACATLDMPLNATASAGTGIWTIETGPGTATYNPDANTVNAIATVTTVGTYTFKWKEVNGVCSDSSMVVMLFANLPIVSYSGLGATYCISDTNAATLTPVPVGGVFTGNGILGNDFYPDSAAVGTNVITYTYTDANGCTNTALDSTVIIGLPIVSFSGLGGPYCEDDFTAVPLTGFPAGGVFTGPGVSGNNFTPVTAGAGLHSITYTYTDLNGCYNSESQPIVVSTLPVVAFTGLDTAYCVDASAATLIGIPAGGTFTGLGVSGNNFDPAVAGVGVHNITYTYTDGNGCTNDSIRSVTVNALPVVSFSGLSPAYCIDASGNILIGAPAGGLFSGPGISGNSFIPSVADTGTHNITYTYTDGNGCINSQVQAVTVTALPIVSFSGLAAAYCVDASSASLTGSPLGGTFSGPGISGTTFDPTVAGSGTHTIKYVYSDGGGCTDSTTQSVVVDVLPSPTFSGLDSAYCIDASAATLTGIPAGGTFTGLGISGSSFDPAVAGIGAHNITYTYTDGNGCTSDSIKSVTVNALPVVSFSGLAASYCVDGATATLIGTPGGGLFMGPGVSGNSFIPSIADTGAHNITYIYTDGNGCTNSQAQAVTVTPLPIVSFSGLSTDYCVAASSATLTGSPVGGTFSGPGISGTSFDPFVAGLGTHTIQYLFTDGNGCSDSTIQSVIVNGSPSVTFSGLDTAYCVDAISANLVGFPSGGVFSGPGVIGNAFDPSSAGGGTHIIKYVYMDGNGCSDSTTQNVTVNTLPVVTFTGLDTSYCIDGGAEILTGFPGGGLFSGNGISGSAFVPSVADTGTHIVSYTYTDANACVSVQLDTTIVIALPIVSFSGLAVSYCVDAAATALVGSPLGGSFSGPGVSGNSFDPAIAGVGVHAVTYLYIGPYGCSDSTSQSVVVMSLPAVTFFGLNAQYCIDAASATLVGFPAGGTFSGNGVTGSTFDAGSAGVGSHAINYTYTNGNGCTKDTTLNTVVNPLPVVVIVANGPTSFCQGGSVGLAASLGFAYLWSNSETTNTITVTTSGSYIVQVTDINLCSDISPPFSVTVNPNPVLAMSASNANCTSGSDGTTTVVASGAVSPYSYLWSDGNAQTDTTATGLSSGTYSVTVTDNNGCIGVDSATVLEPTAPLTSSVITNAVDCNGGADGYAIGSGSGGTSPYSFQWDDGALQTTDTANALTAGTYAVIITDANGCTSTDSGIVSEPTALFSTISTTDISCNGEKDGTAIISVQGGTAPYNYIWSVGQIDTLIIGLSGGISYGITVTDAKGCILTNSVMVNEPAVLALAVSETDIACAGAGNGTATVIAMGGTPAYNYLWSDGQTTAVASDLSGGLISVDVLDSRGCAASIATSITENIAITSTDTSIDATLGQANGQGTVEVFGGAQPYTYLWSDGQITSTATGLVGGTYIVLIDDSVGCTITDTVIVNVAMIEAATAFTPNGDGTNDVWTIGDMSLYPDVEVIVMGRWGQTIFSSIGYQEAWDGTYQGQMLPMGSYFFIIDLHEGSDPVTGSVTIMK